MPEPPAKKAKSNATLTKSTLSKTPERKSKESPGGPKGTPGKKARPRRDANTVPRTWLRTGTVIVTEKGKYRVIGRLGQGGFGSVYKMEEQNTKAVLAMKTEFYDLVMPLTRLHVEAEVLGRISKLDPSKRQHFLNYIDKGRSSVLDVKFLMMEMCSLSLSDIRYIVAEDKTFSKSTILQAGKQTMQGIWDLHEVGFVHRDLKPGNCAVGLGDKDKIIYLLDFGIGRALRTASGQMRKPRPQAPFVGTCHYCSVDILSGKDASWKDDIESWLYMMMDLWDSKMMPLVMNMKDRRGATLTAKKKFWKEKNWKNGFPEVLSGLYASLNQLKWGETPDYKLIMAGIDKVAEELKVNLSDPLDWVGKIEEKKKKAQIEKKKKDAEMKKVKAAEEAEEKERKKEREEREKEQDKDREEALKIANEDDAADPEEEDDPFAKLKRVPSKHRTT
ncbi:unnamed protein product, partial [Mesorhabditis spiculigera]